MLGTGGGVLEQFAGTGSAARQLLPTTQRRKRNFRKRWRYENKGSCALKEVRWKQRMREKKGNRLNFRQSKPGLSNVRANDLNAAKGSMVEADTIPCCGPIPLGRKKRC